MGHLAVLIGECPVCVLLLLAALINQFTTMPLTSGHLLHQDTSLIRTFSLFHVVNDSIVVTNFLQIVIVMTTARIAPTTCALGASDVS